jgi:fluoride ion exporter CrcB/FEX
MWKIIGIVLLLFTGFFLASVFRPLLSQLVTNASSATNSGNTFALALLGSFVVLPIIWVFVRAMNSLRGGSDD